MRSLATMVLLIAASAVAAEQEMTLDAVQGTWYGWLAGTGVEIKIASLPDGAVAYLKTVQPGAPPFLQELRPSVDQGDLVLQSMQAPQPFTMRLRFEGSLLFGTYDDDYSPYTIALARAMPDVEQLFESPADDARPSPMREARAAGRRASSARNLKQIHAGLVAYASQPGQNLYPPLSDNPGTLAPEAQVIYPMFIEDAAVFVSPDRPDAEVLRRAAQNDPLQAIGDHSYWYLGYLLPTEQAALAFLDEYRSLADQGAPIQLGEMVTARGFEIPRLRIGVEQLLVADPANPAEAAAARARIPIMIERPGLQQAAGGNVLFLDGRVEFMPFPGPYPMTEAVIERLLALDELGRAPTTPGQVATP